MKSIRALSIAALIGATLFWAGNYVIGALAVQQMDVFSLVFLRWAIAVVPLFIAAWRLEHPDWKMVLSRWPVLLLLALLGIAIYSFMVYFALQHTTALNASLINALNPALIVIGAVVFLHARVRPMGIVGIVLSFIGVAFILTDGQLLAIFHHAYNVGDLMMLVAIVSWTGYTLVGRRFGGGIPPITSTAVQVAFVLLVLLPFVPLQHVHWPTAPAVLWSLLFIAVFPSILSYVFWNTALQHINPANAAIFMNLITVFTAVASLAMGQPITIVQIIGGALVILGVVLASRPSDGNMPRRASTATSSKSS